MRRAYCIVLCLTMAMLTGCVSKSVTKLQGFQQRPPTEEVDVFLSPSAVGRSYIEGALLTADDGGLGYREDQLVQKLVDQAKKIGADGIIIMGSQTGLLSSGVASGGTFTPMVFQQSVVKAVAIYYQ